MKNQKYKFTCRIVPLNLFNRIVFISAQTETLLGLNSNLKTPSQTNIFQDKLEKSSINSLTQKGITRRNKTQGRNGINFKSTF